MSVVPMQKVRLLVHHSDVDATLDIVQRAGALEFRETTIPNTKTPELVFPCEHLLPRVLHAVVFLKPYAAKVSLWRTLRDGSRAELSESDVAKTMQSTDVLESVVADLEQIQVEFADANEQVRILKEKQSFLEDWKALPIELRQLSTVSTLTKLVKIEHPLKDHTLAQHIASELLEMKVPHNVTEVSPTQVAVTVENDSVAVARLFVAVEAIKATVVVPVAGSETPDVELVAVTQALLAAKNTVGLLHDQAEHFAITHLKTLQIGSDLLTWQRDRFRTVEAAASTAQTVVFSGWLNQQKLAAIETELTIKHLAAVFSEVELVDGEEPPVDIVNSPFVQPFEAVTRLYGMPGYTDLDPTVFLAGFFFLFFGLSLTDVGYGLALVAASVFILLFCKVTKAVRLFAKLLLFIGTSTVFVGMLFGGYLGFDPSLLPAPLQALQLFDPIGNPLPVFYLALGLGVFQVMVGMMLKIYSEARNNRLIDGVRDQGPWLFMFVVGIAYVATVTGYLDVLPATVYGNLAWVGVAMILIAGALASGNVFQRILSALLGLYAGVAHFSDVLSYSRLLALGLATSALAYAVNLIASMVSGVPYVGFLLAGIILLIGHLFTLVINTLGAFIHSARLQFVEFFGKFIAGTGKEFAPLKRSETYVTIIDE